MFTRHAALHNWEIQLNFTFRLKSTWIPTKKSHILIDIGCGKGVSHETFENPRSSGNVLY